MLEILHEAQERFQTIQNLLSNPAKRDSDYFSQLNSATEEAYITMNEGMCANTTVCHECASHRDFLRSMFEPLSELEGGASMSEAYETALQAYNLKVNDILTKISTVFATL